MSLLSHIIKRWCNTIGIVILILYPVTAVTDPLVWVCTGELSKLTNSDCNHHGEKEGCYFLDHFSQYRACSTICEGVTMGSTAEDKCKAYCQTYYHGSNNHCELKPENEPTTMKPTVVHTSLTPMNTPRTTALPKNATLPKTTPIISIITPAQIQLSTGGIVGIVVSGAVVLVVFVVSYVVWKRWKKKQKNDNRPPTSDDNGIELNHVGDGAGTPLIRNAANDSRAPETNGTSHIGNGGRSIQCTGTNSYLDREQNFPNPRPVSPVACSEGHNIPPSSAELASASSPNPTNSLCDLRVDLHPTSGPSSVGDTTDNTELLSNSRESGFMNSVTGSRGSLSQSHASLSASLGARRSAAGTPVSSNSGANAGNSAHHSRASTPTVCTNQFSETDPGPPIPHSTPAISPTTCTDDNNATRETGA